MTFMMLNGLLIFMLFMLTSAEISHQSKLTSGLQMDRKVRHVDIQARGRKCDALEGRCFKEDDDCPADMPLEEVGMPYCKKGKKCCYPGDEYIELICGVGNSGTCFYEGTFCWGNPIDANCPKGQYCCDHFDDEYTEAVCGVGNNGKCVLSEGNCCIIPIDAKCAENYHCCDWSDGTTLVDAVQAHIDKSGVGCCPWIPPPLCIVLGCCCTDENDITPLTDAVQEYIKDPTVICCPLIPFPACMAFNCCCFAGTTLVDAVQAHVDTSGVGCCFGIPPPLCTMLDCCCTEEHDITALTDAVQDYVEDPTVSCCPGVPFNLCKFMDCCC